MVFIKHQVQEINGTQYEYYYLYESYYEPGMEYPQNFKVGKVGEDVSSLVSSYKEKAKSNGIDLSESDLDHFKIQIRTVEEKAEQKDIDEEDKGEFYQEVFNEDAEDNDDIPDPDELDSWKLEQSSYGDEDGIWVWSDKGVYVSFNESDSSVYVQSGSAGASEKVSEFESWEEVVEWLQDKEAENMGREESSKDPGEMNYVYESINRPVPFSLVNNVPDSIEVSKIDRMVGTSEALPYDLFDQYELSLKEKNVEDTFDLKELVKWTGLEKKVLVDAFEEGRNEEIKQAIKNELVKNNFDNQYLTMKVYNRVKSEIEDLEDYGSDRVSISVKVKGTDSFMTRNKEIRENGIVPGEEFRDVDVSRSEFDREVYSGSFGGLRNWKYYVELDSGETMEIGEVYVKGDQIIGSDIDRDAVEAYIPEIEDMVVHEIMDNAVIKGDNKELKKQFARRVLNIVDKYNLGVDYDGRRIWRNLRVTSNKSSRDAYASIYGSLPNVHGISLNVKKYKNAPDLKKREIEIHEAVHFYKNNHYEEFYNKLIEVIGEEYGSIDDFRRFIATDIRASDGGVEPSEVLPDYSEEVFDWELKKFSTLYTKMIKWMQDYADDVDKFDKFTGNMSYEEVGSKVVFRLGQGRGKSRLEIAEVDRITGEVSVKEPEYWIYITKVDLTDGSVIFEDLSKRFAEVLEDMKYSNNNLSDLTNYNRYSKDRYDTNPLTKKIERSLEDYFDAIGEDYTIKSNAKGVVIQHMLPEGKLSDVLKVQNGNVIITRGINDSGYVPVIVDYRDGRFIKEELSGRIGIKNFVNMLEAGERIYQEGKRKQSRYSNYSAEKPEGISIIGIREDEKDSYYRMINSVKARVPEEKFDQLEKIKFTSDLNARGSMAIGTYRDGVIKIDKNKPTLTQYYVIAHEIGHLVEDDTDNYGSERLMKKVHQRTGISYILMPEDREVLDPFRDRIESQDLTGLPEHAQNELNWLKSADFGKQKQSQNNYNYKEVFARAFAVWIVNKEKFEELFPDMAEYLEDFVENRGNFKQEYGEIEV